MAEIDDACRDVVTNVDGAVACGIVDLDTGMLLGSHVLSNFPSEIREMVSGVALELFRGPNAGRIERVIRASGEPDALEQGIQEVHVTSRDSAHFAKILKNGRVAMVLVTKKSANQGIGWAQMKAAIPRIESQLP